MSIRTQPEKPYCILLIKKQFVAWTITYNPASPYQSLIDMKSKIIFLNGQEKVVSMVSRIMRFITNQFITIKYQSLVH